MPIKIEQDGKEIEVFTPEEVAEKDAEITRLSELNKQKTENFKRYNEMTKEEREMYDENTLNLIQRNDKLAEEVGGLKETLAQKETREKAERKESALKYFHNGVEEVKTKLEEKYGLLAGMPEDTLEQVQARTVEAARLAGISVDSRNPIFQPVNGEAPTHKETDNYVETPAGKEAVSLVADAMGIKIEDKK